MSAMRWLIWISVGMGGVAEAASRPPCGTPERIEAFFDVVPQPMPPRPPSADKGERDAQSGVCGNQEVSDNFVLKWGNDANIDAAAVDLIMTALEKSWDVEIDHMGHDAPDGSDEYLFNVYIGDTGGCAPSAFGMGGYYTVDEQGWPFIVLSQGVFGDPGYGKTTVAHEFYHAIQHASGAYGGNPESQWYWEATAMWVEDMVYLGTDDYYVFLYGYAFLPYHQLNSYTYPSAGDIEEYHQYGAFIFPRYISEVVADWTVIRDSWTLAGQGSDVVAVLQTLLPDVDFDVLFGDFAAHNATWDYEDGEAFGDYLDWISDGTAYGAFDDREVQRIGYQGTGEEWQNPPDATLPQRYGYNVIRLSNPDDRKLTVRFEGEGSGSDGSAARFQVRLVHEYSNTVEYTVVDLVDNEAELDVGSVGTEKNLYLVVSAASPDWRPGEDFDYRYQLDMGKVTDPGSGTYSGGPTAMPSGNTETFAGCTCTSSSSPFTPWWALTALLLLRRRRLTPA